jgi:hypothetical protein
MISVKPLSTSLRNAAIDLITERELAAMTPQDLQHFFYRVYRNMLEDYSDAKLALKLEEVATPEEMADFNTVANMVSLADSDLFD